MVTVNSFKYAILTLLKEKYRLKFDQYVALNHVKDKVKPLLKLSHKVFKVKYGYYTFLDISTFKTSIQLT